MTSMLIRSKCSSIVSSRGCVRPCRRRWAAESGREAAADALSYGWEHWEWVRAMTNPAGYLFVVGRDGGRRGMRRRRAPCLTPVIESGHRGWSLICQMLWLDCQSSSGGGDALALLRVDDGGGRGIARCIQVDRADARRSRFGTAASADGGYVVSLDLLDQLAAYGEHHRASQTPIALSEVVAGDPTFDPLT